MKTIIYLSFFLLGFQLNAQNVQNIKGVVYDKDAEMPLIGANVQVVLDEVNIMTITDAEGRFILNQVPVGRQVLLVTYLGYEPLTIPNVVVTSGKEVVLELSMEEAINQLEEVTITSKTPKDRSINDMAAISAKTFSLEEVTRYSGGRNDVSRLASNFAGVATTNDSRNDIVIRGNSPTGVLWRLEGVPIPNPNHFSTLGTTGGPVSALNTNLLKNSDFITSAFPAEYGNALSGVFDVGFRSGNKDKYEFTGQIGAFSGMEAMVEGPLNAAKTSSFLVSYRHSFVALANTAGIDIGTAATPFYKDLSFKLDFGRGSLGKFEVFGIGGDSSIDFIGRDLEDGDLFAPRDADSYAVSRFGVVGVKNTILLNEKSFIRTILSASGSENNFQQDVYLDNTYSEFYDNTRIDDTQTRIAFNSYVNTKHNANLTTRGGLMIERLGIATRASDRLIPDNNGDGIPEVQILRDIDDAFYVIQPYLQNKYKVDDRLTMIIGLHGQFISQTQEGMLEPRLGLNYSLKEKGTINIGYGLHSQVQPLPVFFLLSETPDGSMAALNADLKYSKAHHFVVGYDRNLGNDWRAKVETYYQYLYDVPVEQISSSYSILNAGADFVFPQVGNLVNKGTGRNYGLEITVEKFFSRGYYGLLTGSVFQSKYKGSDGVSRNTAFNNQYVLNLLGGKEWKIGQNNAFTIDFKLTGSGGQFYTPIDEAASQIARTEVRISEEAFSERYAPYFRADLKFGFSINNTSFSQQFFLDFQNLTNRENIFQRRYDRANNRVNDFNQSGFFPDLLYRIQF